MLKTAIKQSNNVDISYPKLITFLKDMYIGYQPKKSKIFQPDEITKFLSEAPDIAFLAIKVTVN